MSSFLNLIKIQGRPYKIVMDYYRLTSKTSSAIESIDLSILNRINTLFSEGNESHMNLRTARLSQLVYRDRSHEEKTQQNRSGYWWCFWSSVYLGSACFWSETMPSLHVSENELASNLIEYDTQWSISVSFWTIASISKPTSNASFLVKRMRGQYRLKNS